MHTVINLDEILTRANRMQPFSASTARLIKLVSSPDYDVSDIVDVVKYDQSLTLKVLCAANTVQFANAAHVGTPQDAVQRLGTAQVMSLAVASGVRNMLKVGLPAYGLTDGELWRHSVMAAIAAEIAPCYCELSSSPEVFTAALLHDIGKLVMANFISGPVLKEITDLRATGKMCDLEAEAHVLGINHAELGAQITEHWNLPRSVIEGIRFHHHPELGSRDICYFAYLSDCVAHKLAASPNAAPTVGAVPPEIAKHLGLTEKKYDKLCEMATARYAKISPMYDSV